MKEGITCQFEALQSQPQIEMGDRDAKVRTAHITETIDAKLSIMYFIFGIGNKATFIFY